MGWLNISLGVVCLAQLYLRLDQSPTAEPIGPEQSSSVADVARSRSGDGENGRASGSGASSPRSGESLGQPDSVSSRDNDPVVPAAVGEVARPQRPSTLERTVVSEGNSNPGASGSIAESGLNAGLSASGSAGSSTQGHAGSGGLQSSNPGLDASPSNDTEDSESETTLPKDFVIAQVEKIDWLHLKRGSLSPRLVNALELPEATVTELTDKSFQLVKEFAELERARSERVSTDGQEFIRVSAFPIEGEVFRDDLISALTPIAGADVAEIVAASFAIELNHFGREPYDVGLLEAQEAGGRPQVSIRSAAMGHRFGATEVSKAFFDRRYGTLFDFTYGAAQK